MLNSGMSTISAVGANIIARFDDAELVAVQHSNGYVGIYAEDGDDLMQVASMRKSDTLSALELASAMMAGI